MSIIDLDPPEVWREFADICTVPHGSGNVDALRKHLLKKAQAAGLQATEYLDSGNLLIIKNADKGFEKAPTVCLQAHLDMVCSKRADSAHDFEHDQIKPQITTIDGKRVVIATGTTLGADDGMGLASALAIVFDKTLKTGKIEVLFTKDEETTMFGVKNLNHEKLECKYLLNLDSEDVGVITIGSAGGFCKTVTVKPQETQACSGQCVTVTVKNCSGGHSGVDAHLYRANAIKQLGRIAQRAMEHGAGLCCMNGGTAHNAIPMDAKACFCFEESEAKRFIDNSKGLAESIKAEFKTTDPNMEILFELKCACTDECVCVPNCAAQKVIDFLNIVPSSVLRMSQDVHGLTESSINLGKVHFCAKDQSNNTFLLLARSSINSYLPYVADQLDAMARQGAIFTISEMEDPYGGWKPDPSSKLLALCRQRYAECMGVKPEQLKVEAIHAGLECAEIMTKFPGQMEAVSIGPTIKNPHSDRELCEIDTVKPFYEVVKRVLSDIAAM